MQKELLAVREGLNPLRKRRQKELMKDKSDENELDKVKKLFAHFSAKELQLLHELERLETRPAGEKWGTAPDTWWQAAHLVWGVSSILWPEDPLAPEFPGRGSGCNGPPSGLASTNRAQARMR